MSDTQGMIPLSKIVNVTVNTTPANVPTWFSMPMPSFKTIKLPADYNRAIISDYLGVYLRPSSYRERVDKALRLLEHPTVRDTFDAIAVTGNSGVLAGAPLSMFLDKPLVLVRKPGATKHTETLVEGALDTKRYIIVDDMIVSGKTMQTVYDSISTFLHNRVPECVGYVMLNEYHYAESGQWPLIDKANDNQTLYIPNLYAKYHDLI